jgi:hypothetical protein
MIKSSNSRLAVHLNLTFTKHLATPGVVLRMLDSGSGLPPRSWVCVCVCVCVCVYH